MSLSLIDCEDKIGWNPSYTIELHEEKEEVYLFSEQMKMGLQGKVYFLLAPLLVQGI